MSEPDMSSVESLIVYKEWLEFSTELVTNYLARISIKGSGQLVLFEEDE